MSVHILGLSHKTAPIEVRERFAVPVDRADAVVGELGRRPGIDEACLISTCNRVEFLVRAIDGVDPEVEVLRFLGDLHRRTLDQDRAFFYRFADREAIRHIFRVASSLDSMVVGEPQILGQVREAYAAAKRAGTIRGPLDHLLTAAIRVARRVRTETGIGKMAVSISYVAVELARKIFGDLEGLNVLIIGAGKMSSAAAAHLRNAGAARLTTTNRTYERAQAMAREYGGEAEPFEKLFELLTKSDIVISSTGSADYIVGRETAAAVIAARRNKPMFLVDIAVPRDFDPKINEIDNVFLYDIDDLREVADANLRQRRKEADDAERIVEEEVETVMRRLRAQQVAPTIVSLQKRLDSLRVAEIERFRSKLGALTPDQEQAVEALTRGLVNKIAHPSITQLKEQAAGPDGPRFVEFVRRAFNLNHHSE